MKINYSIVSRKFFPFILIAVTLGIFSFSPGKSSAQLANYTFTSGSGSALPSGGSIIWQGSPRRSGLVSGAINLGFSFKFDGTSYTQMIVYSSGLISLGGAQVSNSNNPTLQNTNVPVIAGFWGGASGYTGRQSVGLSGGSSQSGWTGTSCGVIPDVEYQMSGVAPNRVMTIEWNHIDVTSTEDLCTWQIRLRETTNAVEIFYVHMTSIVSCAFDWGGDNIPTYAGIGVANGASNFISVTPKGGTSASTSTSAASNAINLQTNAIGDNTLYSFSIPANIQLSVAPKLLSYGLVQAGQTSAPLCTTVKSVGTDATPLIITGATITGSSEFTFSSTPPSNSYPAGSSGQYCIKFKPTLPGVRSAVLTISSTGRDSGLQTVALTGIGTVAELSIDSLIRFKKTRTPLGQTLTQYVHITSTGQVPLVFSSFTISGPDAGQYSISHFPISPLPVGQTDSVGITYSPTIEGKHTANLTILSNAFVNSNVVVSLQGTGILPHIVVTPPIVLFDSTKEGTTVCKTIDIWNPGSDTLKLFSNSLTSNDGDFHYTGLIGKDTLIAPDQHKTVTVCFDPVQQGTRQARLLLRTNIIKTYETPTRDTAGIITVDIRGTGVPFGVFANAVSGSPFTDSAVVGVTVCRTDTLMNKGDADILVTALTIGGIQFNYSGLPAFPFLLKAHSSVIFTICGTPDKAGLISGTATVAGTTSGTKITDVLQLAIYGFQPCISPSPLSLFTGVVLPNNGSDSTLCDTIKNCGDVPTVYSVTISGASKADYSVSPSTSGTVAPHGGTAVFCVKYKPSAVGPSPASLDVASTDGESAKIPLGAADGCAQVAAVVDNIPPQAQYDTTGFFNVTITNTGSFDYKPGQPFTIGDAQFEIISVTTTGTVPNQVITIKMRLHSRTLGSFTAKLFVPGNPCPTDTLSVSLSGTVIAGSVAEATSANGFSLEQSYPNPTQGHATFTYVTPTESEVRISLVDLTGKLVRTLITGNVSEGIHTVNFDASNLPSGTYVYLLESGSTRLVRQLILTR